MTHILLVDDDLELCQLLAEYLELEGFKVTSLHRGDQVLDTLQSRPAALVILDVMMPGLNGFETLQAIRKLHALPVLMMSARGEEVDRILGLEMGADDYLPKPCSPRELVARIRANLRRVELDGDHQRRPILEVSGLRLDPDNLRLSYQGESLTLTHTELSMLQILMQEKGQLVSRETLMQKVLGRRLGPYDRSIDMHLSNIRRKLGPAYPSAVEIRTIRGAGYMLLEGERHG